MKCPRFASTLVVALAAFALPYTAGATVKKEGTWPTSEPKVDLSFNGKPSQGLRRLAREAEWSLVLSDAVAIDGADVHVDVDDQPADAVLEALFIGHDVIAHRNGTLITVRPAGAADAIAPPAPPTPPTPPTPPAPRATEPPSPPNVPPVPAVRGEDRNVIGGKLDIGKDEVLHTVTVAGGALHIEGTLTGDLIVVGGSAKILNGGRVVGNVTVFGGAVRVEDGARIDGDVGVVGGSVKREDGAIIGGRITDAKHGNIKVSAGSDGLKTEVSEHRRPSAEVSEKAHEFGQSVTKMAFLFVLGCVLLALLARPMDRVRTEVAAHPMRSLALGIPGGIASAIVGGLLLLVLCITVIGIPVALGLALFAAVAVYGAIASVLTTFGAAVSRHRTENQYIHLLIGCLAFLVLSSIPFIGGVTVFAVVTMSIGALLTTRFGGLFSRHPRPTGLV